MSQGRLNHGGSNAGRDDQDHARDAQRDAFDQLFDRELDAADRSEVIRRLSARPQDSRELRGTADAVRRLREPVEAPDFTASVLAEVTARRGFASQRARRRVRQGRLAVAAALLGVLGGVAVMHRVAPDVARLSGAERPVADFASAVAADSRALLADVEDVSRVSFVSRGRPVTAQPVTAQPVTSQPVTAQPVTAQPVTGQPSPSGTTSERDAVAAPTRLLAGGRLDDASVLPTRSLSLASTIDPAVKASSTPRSNRVVFSPATGDNVARYMAAHEAGHDGIGAVSTMSRGGSFAADTYLRASVMTPVGYGVSAPESRPVQVSVSGRSFASHSGSFAVRAGLPGFVVSIPVLSRTPARDSASSVHPFAEMPVSRFWCGESLVGGAVTMPENPGPSQSGPSQSGPSHDVSPVRAGEVHRRID